MSILMSLKAGYMSTKIVFQLMHKKSLNSLVLNDHNFMKINNLSKRDRISVQLAHSYILLLSIFTYSTTTIHVLRGISLLFIIQYLYIFAY